MDPLENFKAVQKQGWAHFGPLEAGTTLPALRLVQFAGVRGGQKVLDAACGTGVVAITAARAGARATGLDMTPELLERARYNSRLAELEVDWHEGDIERMPFADGEFDVVLSQFGHMFAPRPVVTIAEMLRVLRPGGTIAFSTWPPELLVGRMFALVGRNLPPPPPGTAPPGQWGDRAAVRERMGGAVRDVEFETATLKMPVLSPQHFRVLMEQTVGPVRKVVESLAADAVRLAAFRGELDALAAAYFRENAVHQEYLMTRAKRV